MVVCVFILVVRCMFWMSFLSVCGVGMWMNSM